MMKALKFLLSSQMRRTKVVQLVDGFTLIELLVAIILAVLIITPLMGFMINIMDTDRREQAKANSEQEIQAALDYIARDLQQAIYIYDATGIDAIKSQLPSATATDRVPVLVFWKRELISQATTAADGNKNDSYVYSLVAYYLIQDPSSTTNSIWSNAARIARWQIKDGLPGGSSDVTCTGFTGTYISGYCPSPGFALFKLDGIGTITQKMNAWTNSTATTGAFPASVVLVDFIDQTKTNDTSNPAPAPACTTSIPSSLNTLDTANMTGFYACINTNTNAVQVFLRGNATARIETDINKIKYSAAKSAYFPSASIQVQGRAYLYTQ